VPVFDGRPLAETPPLHALRERVRQEMACVREDHYLPLNPTPYKVSVSSALYDFLQEMCYTEAPIKLLE
jgi:nicotinate phosphoribosyltransferase